MLRVMLVDESSERAEMLRVALGRMGCQVVAQISNTDDLLQQVGRTELDLIIIDTDSPDRDTLEHVCLISQDQPKPIVMFSHDDDSNKIRQAIRAGVSAYVVDGLKSERIKPIVDAAIARFEEFQALRREVDKAESKLAERKDIERAKGVLMTQRGWSEDEAYQALRKTAMDRGVRLVDVARQLINVAELLG